MTQLVILHEQTNALIWHWSYTDSRSIELIDWFRRRIRICGGLVDRIVVVSSIVKMHIQSTFNHLRGFHVTWLLPISYAIQSCRLQATIYIRLNIYAYSTSITSCKFHSIPFHHISLTIYTIKSTRPFIPDR
jgi:hypothetical protein